MALNASNGWDTLLISEKATLLHEGSFREWAALLYGGETDTLDLDVVVQFLIAAYGSGTNLLGLDVDEVVIAVLESADNTAKTSVVNLMAATNIVSSSTQSALIALI